MSDKLDEDNNVDDDDNDDKDDDDDYDDDDDSSERRCCHFSTNLCLFHSKRGVRWSETHANRDRIVKGY